MRCAGAPTGDTAGGGKRVSGRLRQPIGLDRDAWLVIGSNATVGICQMGILSVIQNLFLLRLGYGMETIGVLTSLGSITVAALGLPIGFASVRLGSRRCFILAFGMATVGTLFLPFALVAYEPFRIFLLGVSRIVVFVGGTFFLVNVSPVLASVTIPKNRNLAFAINGAAGSAGGILGSILGGVLPIAFSVFAGKNLTSPHPFAYTAVIAGVLYFAFFIVAFGLRKSGQERNGHRDVEQGKAPLAIVVMASVHFLIGTGFGTASLFTVFLDSTLHMSTSGIGFLLSASSIASLLSVALMPFIASRLGKSRTVLVSILCMSLGMGIVGSSFDWIAVSLGWMILAAFNAVMSPALSVYIMELVPDRWRSLMSGAANSAYYIGNGISAMGGGFFVARVGFRGYYLTGACVLLAALLLFRGFLLTRGSRGQGLPAAIEPGRA